MHASPYRLAPAVALVALVGCSAPVVAEGDEGGERSVQGFIAVERISSEGAVQTNVSAKFVRISNASVDELVAQGGGAEDILGGSLELPPVGECVVMSHDGSVAGAGASGSDRNATGPVELDEIEPMHLIDVGDVTLRSVGPRGVETLIPLAPRAFPDVGDLVSGMFYSSPDVELNLPAPAHYSLEGSGASDFDHFVISAEAPQPPERVFIDGRSLGMSHADEPLTLLAGSDLRLEWMTPSTRTTPDEDDALDLIYVDMVSARSGQAVRCSFADEGRGVVPGALVASESLLGPTTIGVHRVHIQELGAAFADPDSDQPAPDIDFGQIRFDLSLIGWANVIDGS